MNGRLAYREEGRIGEGAEDRFVRAAQARGWQTEKASVQEDRHQHWDIRLTKPGTVYRVDIKCQKSVSRPRPFVTVEIHANQPDDYGWLLNGHADFIVFELPQEFCFVPRLELMNRVHSLAQLNDQQLPTQPPWRDRVWQRPERPTEKCIFFDWPLIQPLVKETWTKGELAALKADFECPF